MPEKEEGDQSKKPNVSRVKKMREDKGDDDFEPEMPPLDAPYMASYLFEIGPTVGEHAITHGEIDAWQRNTGIELTSWECRTLKHLSNEFLRESHAATRPDAPSPWIDAPYVKPAAGVLLGRIKAAFQF